MLEAIGLFVLGLVLLALGGDSIVKGASGLAQRLGAYALRDRPGAGRLRHLAAGTGGQPAARSLHGQRDARAGQRGRQQRRQLRPDPGRRRARRAAAWCAGARCRPLLLVLVLGTAGGARAGCRRRAVAHRRHGAAARLRRGASPSRWRAVAQRAAGSARGNRRLRPDQHRCWARTCSASASAPRCCASARSWSSAVQACTCSAGPVASAPPHRHGHGLSPLLTGLLPVAIGTALPEIAAAIAAARRGQGDMVVGHVIGSSLFNLLRGRRRHGGVRRAGMPMTVMAPGTSFVRWVTSCRPRSRSR